MSYQKKIIRVPKGGKPKLHSAEMASSSYKYEDLPPRVLYDIQQPCDNSTDSNSSDYRLLRVLSLSKSRSPATWGITIVRIDYKAPRQQLLNALACINDAVRGDLGARRPYLQRKAGMALDDLIPTESWPSMARKQRVARSADELFARYNMELLSQYYSLNEACTDTIRDKFQSWIMRMQGNTYGGDMRYVFCLILDADTISQLHDIWCLSSRVRVAQERTQVRLLDAIPGDECKGAYKVYLRGRHGLVNFWFTRSARQQPLEMMLTRPPCGGDDTMWCFGPPEPAPPLENEDCDDHQHDVKGKGKARLGGARGRGWKKGQ